MQVSFYTTGGLQKRANARQRYASVNAEIRLDAAIKSYREADRFDIFLSHRYMDYLHLEELKEQLEENFNLSVYVDHKVDADLDRKKVDKGTADLLRKRMKQCRCLFFATTVNSLDSKWMPWELGYFDGMAGKVAIVPVFATDPGGEKYEGTEYLGLYPYITKGEAGGKHYLWVHETEKRWANFEEWMKTGKFISLT